MSPTPEPTTTTASPEKEEKETVEAAAAAVTAVTTQDPPSLEASVTATTTSTTTAMTPVKDANVSSPTTNKNDTMTSPLSPPSSTPRKRPAEPNSDNNTTNPTTTTTTTTSETDPTASNPSDTPQKKQQGETTQTTPRQEQSQQQPEEQLEEPSPKRARSSTQEDSNTATHNNDNENNDNENSNNSDSNNNATAPIVSYLLEEGKVGPNGQVQPTQLRMTLSQPASNNNSSNNKNNNNNNDGKESPPQMIRLQAGDDVMVFQEDEDDDNDDNNDSSPNNNDKPWPPARIQSFTEKDDAVFFTAQWFLSKQDISLLPHSVPWKGPLSREELLNALQDDTDIVLSNQTDENEIGAIFGLARIQFGPNEGGSNNENEHDNQDDETNSKPMYTCRYQLEVKPNEMILSPYSDAASISTGSRRGGDNDSYNYRSTTRHNNNNNNSSNNSRMDVEESDSEESDDESDAGRAVVAAEGEGSILRESIEVGPEYQAQVPLYNPKTAHVPASRGAKLVWKKGAYTDEQLSQFLAQVAQVHTPFLDRHGLSQPVAYTPVLDPDQVDAILEYRGPQRLTGSSLSTASMLAQTPIVTAGGSTRGGKKERHFLRKECDVDALLEILMDSQGDVSKAVDSATRHLERITSSAWTTAERARYDEGFRKHSGALRKIAKSLAPQKSMQDVVDYHFRCKIPNQFRQYYEQKREIAVRIVECMEEKKTYQLTAAATAPTSNGKDGTTDVPTEPPARRSPVPPSTPAPQHWSETSVQQQVSNQGFSEGRRRKARELMLDVQELLGHDILAEVADRIRLLNEEGYSPEARKSLLSVLQGHADLQKRFMDFLPKNVGTS